MQALAKHVDMVVGRLDFQRRRNLDLHTASCSRHLDIQAQPQSQDFGLLDYRGGNAKWRGRHLPRLGIWSFHDSEEIRRNQSQYHLMCRARDGFRHHCDIHDEHDPTPNHTSPKQETRSGADAYGWYLSRGGYLGLHQIVAYHLPAKGRP